MDELCPVIGPDGVRYIQPSGEECALGGPQSTKRKLRENARWVEAGRLPGNRGREDLDALVSFIEGNKGNAPVAKRDEQTTKNSKSRGMKTSGKSFSASSASSDSGDGGESLLRPSTTSGRDSGDSTWSPSPVDSHKPPQTASASTSGLTSDVDEPDDTEAFQNSPPAAPAAPAAWPAEEPSSGSNSVANETHSRCETVTESDENDAADDEDELFTPVRARTCRRAKQHLPLPAPSGTAARRSPVARKPDSLPRRAEQPRYTKQTSYPGLGDPSAKTVAVQPRNAASARPALQHSVSTSVAITGAGAKPAWNVVATQRANPAARTVPAPVIVNKGVPGKPGACPSASEPSKSPVPNTTDETRLREARMMLECAFRALVERKGEGDTGRPRVVRYCPGLCCKTAALTATNDVNGCTDAGTESEPTKAAA